MVKKESTLKLTLEKAEGAIKQINVKIEELGRHTAPLYDAFTGIQDLFDAIRNVPHKHWIKYKSVMRLGLNGSSRHICQYRCRSTHRQWVVPVECKDRKRTTEKVFILISERDADPYQFVIVELSERITHIVEETTLLHAAIEYINTFGLDYCQMTEKQQYTPGTYVNLMSSLTQLLANSILGLQPQFNTFSINKFEELGDSRKFNTKQERLIATLASMLYKIPHDDKNSKLLTLMLHPPSFYLSGDYEIFLVKESECVILFLDASVAYGDELRDIHIQIL